MKLREKVQKAFSRQMLYMRMSGSVKTKVKWYLGKHFREEEKKKELAQRWLLQLRKVNK